MARSRAKKLFGFIHLWVGLVTGIVIFLISITGCMYVFRDELFNLVHAGVQINNATQKQATLPLNQLWDAAQKQLGSNIPVKNATAFNAPKRNWEFRAGKYNDKAITYFNWVEYDYIVYVNPYTAHVAGVVNHKYEFFQLVKMLHWSLLLHTRYGQPIVGASILLFLVSLITGLVIWWPKNFRQFKETLQVKWKARWRRINYDLHRSLAVYILPIAIIIAVTGLVWAFQWMQAAVYVAAAQTTTPPEKVETKSTYDTTATWQSETQLLNNTVESTLARYPAAYSVSFFPTTRTDTTGTLETYIRPNGMVYYNGISEHHDQYSGKLLHTSDFNKRNNGEKLIYMNYDIHVGQILGIPGKILAFVASLVCALLPVTGFLIWWGRRTIAQQKIARVKKQTHASEVIAA